MTIPQILHKLIKAGYCNIVKIDFYRYKFIFTTPQGYVYVQNGWDSNWNLKKGTQPEYHIYGQDYHVISLYNQYFH